MSETYETLYETADFKQFWSTERSRKFEFVALSKKKARYNTSPYLLSDISLLRADRLTSPESTEKHFCRNTTFGSTNHPVLSRKRIPAPAFRLCKHNLLCRRRPALHQAGQSQFPCQKPRPSVHYPSRIRPHQKHAEKEGGSTPSIFEMCAVMRCANYQLTIAPNSTRAAKRIHRKIPRRLRLTCRSQRTFADVFHS